MTRPPETRRISSADGSLISSANPFPVTGTITAEDSGLKYKFALYQPTSTTLYMGWALPGTGVTTAGWKIIRYDFSGPVFSGTTEFVASWANGTSGLDFIWASCTGYTY